MTGCLARWQLAIDGAPLACSALEPVGIPRARSTARSRQPSRRRLARPVCESHSSTRGWQRSAAWPSSPPPRLVPGRENGARVYRLTRRAPELTSTPSSAARGSALAVDGAGRLVLRLYADPSSSPVEERLPQDSSVSRRGIPGSARVRLSSIDPLPRRVDRMPAAIPRAWGGRAGGAMLPRSSGWRDRCELASSAPAARCIASRRQPAPPITNAPSGQYLPHQYAGGPRMVGLRERGIPPRDDLRVSSWGVTRLAGLSPIHTAALWALTAISTSRSRPLHRHVRVSRRSPMSKEPALHSVRARVLRTSTIAAVMPRT